MQRDVKVGLVLGVLLVAVIAVLFFRKDEDEQEKFSQLLPSPEAVVDRARDALGPSASEPYPVAPEHLADKWNGSLTNQPVRTPAPGRAKSAEPSPDDGDAASIRSNGPGSVVLLPPESGTTKPAARPKLDALAPVGRTGHSDSASHLNAAGVTEYTIQEGDTLSSIASRFLKSSSQYPLIFEANRDVLLDPDHVPVGRTIRIPNANRSEQPASTATATVAPAPRPKKPAERERPYAVYEVQEGDTLFGIAREHYAGRTSMYWEILQANKDQLATADELRPGMVLKLPQEKTQW